MDVQAVQRDSVPGALLPGSQLGRYQILKRIAVGGMAELYLARQTGDAGYEKIVALKRVLPHLTEDVAFVRMFLNEAKLAAGLSHSNIVHVVDFGSEGGEHFMAMEYVHGRSVQDILRAGARHGGVPRDVALTIVHEVAAALHYAHERAGADGRPLGLVHRDVSPSNVLVSFDGDVKLVDFGIAKATEATRVTRSGGIKGKLAYMAPEQVRGEAVDRRADVFALAVVAYELCTGRRCFSAPGEFALINRVAEGRYEKPTAADPDFPADLEAIIARGLAVDPADRFESARQLQRAVEVFASGSGDRISRLSLSEYLGITFGQEAYPTTQMLPPASASQTYNDGQTVALPASDKRRATIWLVSGALGLGLLAGLGGPALLGDDAKPAADAVPDDRAGVDAPSVEAPDDDAATPSPAPPVEDPAAEDPVIVIEDETGGTAAGEPPAAAKPSPAKSKAKRRKRRDKGGSKDASGGGGSKPPEYLPPSRRGG